MAELSRKHTRRFLGVIAFAVVAGVILCFLAFNPGKLSVSWLKVGGVICILEAPLLGWWLWRKHRTDWPRYVFVAGLFGIRIAILWPMSTDNQEVTLDLAMGLFALSAITRLVVLVRTRHKGGNGEPRESA